MDVDVKHYGSCKCCIPLVRWILTKVFIRPGRQTPIHITSCRIFSISWTNMILESRRISDRRTEYLIRLTHTFRALGMASAGVW
jgi:hypothetical protein